MVQDYTDEALADWAAIRPDLDVSTSAVFNRVLRLARLVENALNDVAAAHGLSHKGDFDTLAALRRRAPDHEMSPTQLAEAALITTGGMTARLDRLEAAGLVVRRADPKDRRAILVGLTDDGGALVDRVAEDNLAKQGKLIAALGDAEQTELARMLRDVLIDLGDE